MPPRPVLPSPGRRRDPVAPRPRCRRLRWLLAIWLAAALPASARQSDRGDGTFANPPLYADYPDPDIIRVGADYYFATTTFVSVPGLTILHSRDLVNWEIAAHVIPRLEGRPQYDLRNGTAYRAGVYAPSLRYRDSTFYVAVTPVDQNTRIYQARDIHGPWSFHELDRAAFDPGLFFDADGTAYIATSGNWDGHVTLLKLSADLSRVVEARGIFYRKGIEGTKVIRRGGWYYFFNARPYDLSLQCTRARSLDGPFETIEVLNDRTGGHQGAIVDLPDGGWYGFVMRDCGAVGRMTYLCPIAWRDDWPVWGEPDAPGRVPAAARKPIAGQTACQPPASDGFDSPTLGLQWQWNHNPDDSRWSLTERPGWLRLRPAAAASFWLARNTLTQKGQGPWSRGDVKLDLRHLRPGDVCGFGTLGSVSGGIAARCGGDGRITLGLEVSVNGGATETRAMAGPVGPGDLWLRTELDFVRNRGRCAYSLDGARWTPLGGEFDLTFDWRNGTFQGEQYAVFCFNPSPGEGFVDVDWFHFADAP